MISALIEMIHLFLAGPDNASFRLAFSPGSDVKEANTLNGVSFLYAST
jgi:hypothetical protein